MKLYGTTTSPFVRRVRIVAAEVGEPVERIDTRTPSGLAELHGVTPIGKVPVAVIDGRLLFDSHVIIDWLLTTRGWHGLVPPRDRWRTHNIVNAIDAALDSMIQLLYLRREGVMADGTPYSQRRADRANTIFAWLGAQLAPGGKTFDGGLGIAEIALITTLDWMDFRKSLPADGAAGLSGVREAFRNHPSVASTMPQE